MLGPSNLIDLPLDLWQQDAIDEDEYDLDELINEVRDLHGEQHAICTNGVVSFPDTEAEVEASNLSTLVDTGETTRRPAWHSCSAVSRRVNDLERKFEGRSWDPAWGPQPAGMTAARMAALLDLFAEEEVEAEAPTPTPTWAFPATDPRSQLPEVKEEEA